ncbi:hypothetical protein [Legionella jamestowniensis]|uniref:Uncharacterized protein n=1 Tax=Legionella jamestowniensis TaxID=455 RepID=A0A0W0UGJ3_9GAMM|nr:hypothetical protein [Legionella jamestowniensis]KTD06975.1 hypothetical protein Ljam_1170 [Legionella jamestowniensis]SFM04321.1 hypothetical protein SAMN02746073_0116 [Legionella jamestowniensis DSM 19215]
MKIEVYNELIRLHRVANDANQTADVRRQATEDFERLFQASDETMKQIVQDAIAPASSTQGSLLYTYRAALTDYSRSHSIFSAADTFFRVGGTRLTNPEEPTPGSSFSPNN